MICLKEKLFPLKPHHVKHLWLRLSLLYYQKLQLQKKLLQNKNGIFKIPSLIISFDMFFSHDWWWKRVWTQSETWGLDIHTASQQAPWMRPRQQLCGELGSNLGSTVKSMGVRRSEEKHQRKQHKEVVKGGRREEKCKDRNKERRGERWGMAVFRSFWAMEFSVLLCPQWMYVLQQYADCA